MLTPNVHIIKLRESTKIPTKNYLRPAGWDLYCADENVEICPLRRTLINTGIAIAKDSFPSGTYGRIADKSGLAFKNGIHVLGGVVDPDYTGEIKVILINFSNDRFTLKAGEIVAQLIFEKYEPNVCLLEVGITLDESDPNNRNKKGFGGEHK